MNQIWKRTASLALSAVLLWNSVPMGAFATEENPENQETTVVTTQPEDTNADPMTASTDVAATKSEGSDGDAFTPDEDETEGVLVDCPVKIDNEQMTANGPRADYIDGVLILKKNVDSVSSVENLVVKVDDEITITGALSSDKGITIKGNGQLTVGSIAAGDNLEIEDATVKVGSADKAETETKQEELIKVKNTIKVSGVAHLVTAKGHKAVVCMDQTEGAVVKVLGNGYYRTAAENGFNAIKEDSTLPKTPVYVEVVADEHLAYEAIDGEKHGLQCSDDCEFEVAGIEEEAHTNEQEAGCGKRAKCSKCGEYGEIINEHPQEETKFELVDAEKHKQVYECCGADVEDSVEDHQITYAVDSEAGNVLNARCDCELTGTITISATTSCEYDGNAHGATVTVSEGLAVEAPTVHYLKQGVEEELEEAPTEIGSYTAYIEMGEGEAKVRAEADFRITNKNISNANVTVTVAGEYVYNGQPHEPGKEDLTVTMGETNVTAYSIEGYENNTNAGTAKVLIALEDYEGTVAGTFTITPAAKPTISDANKPNPGFIRENENKSDVPVLTEDNKGKTDDNLALEYSWDSNENYSPVIPAKNENGSYWLYYRSVKSDNYNERAEGKVKVVVTPYLKATSGQKLADVKLPAGWEWFYSNGLSTETPVGKVSSEGNPFKAEYTNTNDSELSATVDVKVIVEGIVPDVTVASHVRYAGNKQPEPTVKIGETLLVKGTDYTVSWSNNDKPGKATVTVKAKEGGAYQFEDVSKEFVIYQSYNSVLGNSTILSAEITAMEKYDSVDKIKAELDAEIEKLGILSGERKYFNFAMKNAADQVAYDEYFWPNDPITVASEHIGGEDANSSYKAVGIYTVTSERLGVEAGDVVELPVNFSTKSATTGKPQIQANSYMVVCLAVEAQFRITTDATGIKFQIGDQTTVYNQYERATAGDLVTVVVEPQNGKQLSNLYYSYANGANTTNVTIDKNTDGKYTFEMPAKDIVIHATFAEVVPNQPVVKDLTYTGQAQQLVDAAVVTEGKVKYRLNSMAEDEYTENVASIKGTAAGAYKVLYRHEDSDGNVIKEDFVIAVIRPKMAAVEFGKTLADAKLPDGFAWNPANPEATAVGNVGGNNKFLADFAVEAVTITVADTANQVDKSSIEVEIEVQPKAATPDVTLTSDHVKYEANKENKAEVTVKLGTETLRQGVDYELTWKNVTKPGIATVIVKGINYSFTDISKNYYIYQPKHDKLDSSTVELSDDLEAANYTKDSIKTKLSEQYDETYPELNRSYYNCAMADSENGFDYDINVWPDSAVTFYLDYPANTDKNDTFKAFMMRSTDDGEGRTGDIEDLTVTKVAVNNESKLKIELTEPAVVVLAYEVKDSYEVTVAAADNGTVKFTVGEDTTEKTSAEVEYGKLITVHVTPNTNYAVSKLQYTYKDGTTTKAVTIKQDDNGKYTFTMPERDITLKATFSKKTTSTKNPYSGDTSNITLWITMMAASAVGITALVLLLIKSRKK